MSLFLLWLTGCSSCSGQPDSIPAKAGKVTEDIAPDLLTASSPDLVVIPWSTLAALSVEDYRDCPLVYVNSSQIYVDAGGETGCGDSAGIHWQGTASATFSGSNVTLDFNDFGPVKGVPSPWSALGTVQLTPTNAGSGQRVTTRLAVTSYGPGEKLDFWNESSGGLTYYGGIAYMDHVGGTIGIESWGTAGIEEFRIPLSLTNGCVYGNHAAGLVGISAQNEATFSFQQAEEASLGAPPPSAADTGGVDTGDSGAGGGGGGGGSSSGGDSNVIPNPTGAAGELCGVCTELAIEGQPVPGCIAATRTISWPFAAPF